MNRILTAAASLGALALAAAPAQAERVKFDFWYGNTGAIARIISFMIRASLRKTEQVELRQLAAQFGVTNHPDYIC
jgi:hypothetical protein